MAAERWAQRPRATAARLLPESPGPLAPPSEQVFRRFQALIRREAGIALNDSKRALLVGRLSRRLRVLGCPGFAEYYERVARPGSAELQEMLDLVATNETRFFREPQHFAYLEHKLCPEWRAAIGLHRVRVWSAACSTGEEPYSIAMTLLAQLPPGQPLEARVLATDLSGRALRAAQVATWPIERKAQIPPSHLKAFMLRGVGAQRGKMAAGSALREAVQFQQVNLNAPALAVLGRFEAIFCRNAMIYFGREERARLVARFVEHLAPGGHLFLGHAETLNGIDTPLRPVQPTVYALPGAPRRAGAAS